MVDQVRVRIAPSPTGHLHVGNVRTALFGWLFARHDGGVFILRIDDTDVVRSEEEYEQIIYDDLRWLNLDWDEGPDVGGDYGPYRQSECQEMYVSIARELLGRGLAYECFCTAEELEQQRQEQVRRKKPPRYDRRCANLTEEQREAYRGEGRKPVIRFFVPDGPPVTVHDLIRNDVQFDRSTIGDFVLVKSTGGATYNFASVIDDHRMEISHILRGEGHLSNTPKQILLFEALGWPLPQFGHFPMILGPDRSKLSKRHGATSLSQFREAGYLPEALVNYLALLGWSSKDDREYFSRDELIQRFDLSAVKKGAAIFDREKLHWMNGHYMTQVREQGPERILNLVIEHLVATGLLDSPPDDEKRAWIRQIIDIVAERLKVIPDFSVYAGFFFVDDIRFDPKACKKGFKGEAVGEILADTADALEAIREFSVENVEAACRTIIERREISARKLIYPVRVATTGKMVGPGLFELVSLLGQERAVGRIRRAVRMLEVGELP